MNNITNQAPVASSGASRPRKLGPSPDPINVEVFKFELPPCAHDETEELSDKSRIDSVFILQLCSQIINNAPIAKTQH
jgi:hypothetical protein